MGETWEERHRKALDVFVPWVEQIKLLRGALVIEFGVGRGAAAAAWAKSGASVIGLDIVEHEVEEARSRCENLGLSLDLQVAPFEELLGLTERHKGAVDVFMLYAVLEHMTPMERVRTLSVARNVIKKDGIIVVIESPNRNSWFDHHTTSTALFDQLPDEIAFLAYRDINREDIRAPFAVAAQTLRDEASVARARLGRGIGHHELELVFGELQPITAHCNWEPSIMMGAQGVHREQLALAKFMQAHLPRVPVSFSRYYIDVILKPDGEGLFPYVRPLPMHTENSCRAVYTKNDFIRVEPGGNISVDFPVPATSLVIGLTVPPDASGRGVELQIDIGGPGQLSFISRRFDPAQQSWISYEDIYLPIAVSKAKVVAPEGVEVSFLGYRPVR